PLHCGSYVYIRSFTNVRSKLRGIEPQGIQSYVRDPAQRELLYELDLAREHLLATAADDETSGLVDKFYANLLRMWGDF
ncbi:MAG: hypothetical protein KZQ59_11580, partial [Candidatus Thiodiazotropha sp. (ex Lucinoma aequizonata)]|nr:hypothetical protein [Candidatus Thiodiazotropha sp. (ex Lucinoma aequizonata)]MCU7899501.1 hypothetical protein [Candidatus Thiodiazotropha sp. (ex Lucinoma aequizonata)]